MPDMRGSDCPIWAFALNQPERSGYSVHRVVEKVDAGEVLRRQPVAVRDEPTFGDYMRRLQREGTEAFVDVIDQLLQGRRAAADTPERRGPVFPAGRLVDATTSRAGVRKPHRAPSRLTEPPLA